MTILAIYPGTFDPMTHGHYDIIMRASKLFERLIVGVALSDHKQALFPHERRIELTKIILENLPHIQVMGFEGLTVDFARSQRAKVLIRGLRGVADLQYELNMNAMNRQMASEIETVFLAPTAKYGNISSSMVRNIAKLGGDISPFVDKVIIKALAQIFN